MSRARTTHSLQRHIVISADGHAFSPGNGSTETRQLAELDAYLERSLQQDCRDYFDVQLGRLANLFDGDDGLFAAGEVESFGSSEAAREGGLDGLFDSDRRNHELEGQGICAEVLFPNDVPFSKGVGGKRYSLAHRIAGYRSYNRWLADFCGQSPGRRAGLAYLDLEDIATAAEEVRWARDHGLRGVNINAGWWDDGLPPYYDERYEPIWSTCEELAMPVHFHGGVHSGDYGDYGAMAFAVQATEATLFFGNRAFPFLVWGGVMERHPELKFVFTEARSTWIPLLAFMDRLIDERKGNDLFAHVRRSLSLKPSEYFHRQVYVGASMMSREQALERHELGLGNLMWGADYPHYEGTWPNTTRWLKSALGGLPVDEVRTILAETPAQVYGFDLDELAPLAARIGPTFAELAGEPDERLWEW